MTPTIVLRRLLDTCKFVCVALFAFAIILSLWTMSVNAENGGDPSDSYQAFDSIEDAQGIVPFKIAKMTSIPRSMVLTGVGVTRTDGDVRVDILYQDSNGDAIQFVQDTRETSIHGPILVSSQATVNGARAEVITGSNVAGTQLGIVHWRSDDVSYTLIASRVTGQSLVPHANSIQGS